MRKIYCENCRGLIGFSYCTQYIQSKGLSLEEHVLSDGKNEDILAMAINLNDDCPHYKRKWWKFWA